MFLIELLALKHNASDSLYDSLTAELTRRLGPEERDRHLEDDNLAQQRRSSDVLQHEPTKTTINLCEGSYTCRDAARLFQIYPTNNSAHTILNAFW